MINVAVFGYGTVGSGVVEVIVKNSEMVNKKAYYTIKCEGCGKEFISYADNTRKYCSRECYFKTRAGV